MPFLSQYEYYANSGNTPADINWGEYQYVTLKEIVEQFMLMVAGNNSWINNEPRYKVLFHVKQSIKSLNYDALKEVKALSEEVDSVLRIILPSDYVNWARISYYKNGQLYPMQENRYVRGIDEYLRDQNNSLLFDQNGEVLSAQFSNIDLDRIRGTVKTPYTAPGAVASTMLGYYVDGQWYFDMPFSGRLGLDGSDANVNPTFKIDKKGGVIHFDSSMQGERVVVEYVSDGMENGDDSLVSLNKMFEDFVYKDTEARLCSSKRGIPEYVTKRIQKERKALWNNARIRMMNLNPATLLSSLRAQSTWIK